ncbi:MAG: hypothetical protein R3E64_03925 [Halioglobus sp.]
MPPPIYLLPIRWHRANQFCIHDPDDLGLLGGETSTLLMPASCITYPTIHSPSGIVAQVGATPRETSGRRIGLLSLPAHRRPSKQPAGDALGHRHFTLAPGAADHLGALGGLAISLTVYWYLTEAWQVAEQHRCQDAR